MSAGKWAPSPWRVTHQRDDGAGKWHRWEGSEVVDANGHAIARFGELIDGSGRQREPLRTLDVAAATANLVALAPELAQMVEDCALILAALKPGTATEAAARALLKRLHESAPDEGYEARRRRIEDNPDDVGPVRS